SHFFSLGGDSLLATQVISALRECGLSAEQPLRFLFAQPVLADFAAGLIAQDVEPVCTLTSDPEARFEPFPLTEIQRAYWMGQSPGLPLNCGTHYLVELDGEDVNIGRLENAWNSLE
ncbi:phosphopantetheine-binding protein, partial [Vibrio lentus]|uniref:phosphopantetheine-binding protein n=1 Tax=Vibrio lentus TaxID=136468 RepID=UPI0035E87C62